MVQYSAATTHLDRVSAAISDPTRRAILERLARGSARISDVAMPFSMSVTGFCRQVRVLERAGLVRPPRPRKPPGAASGPPARCHPLDPQLRTVLEHAPRPPSAILHNRKGEIVM